MSSDGEWSIKDEATGRWMTTGNIFQHSDTYAFRGSYYDCARRYPAGYESVRIVPSPPLPPTREMADAECWEWLKTNSAFAVRWNFLYENFACYRCHEGESMQEATGATPCDAIRAARKKLEGR